MICLYVRVLSLRSGVIHGFCDRALILWSCPVFMWMRSFECARAVCSLVCMPCFVLERGVRIPALFSWVSVSCQGSDTQAPCSVSFWEHAVSSSLSLELFCPRVLCFLLLHAVRVLSASCIHAMSFAVWHTACVFIGCMLSCCHLLCEHVSYEYSH